MKSEAERLDEKETAERRLEVARQQAEADVRNVMSTAAGRRFVWRLLDGVCNVHGPSYSADTGATAYNEGRRSVAHDIMQLVKKERLLYAEMLVEAVRADVTTEKP